MAIRRVAYVFLIAALALISASFSLLSQNDSEAAPFSPSSPGVTLFQGGTGTIELPAHALAGTAGGTLSANDDIGTKFNIGAGPDGDAHTVMDNTTDSNFGGAGQVGFSPAAFGLSSVTVGLTVGYTTTKVNLGILNAGCLTPTQVPFQFVSASTDIMDVITPSGPDDNRLINLIQDNTGSTGPGTGTSNGIEDGAEQYPSFFNALFPGLTPVARYWASQIVPGTTLQVSLQLLIFAPGDLFNHPAISSSDLLTSSLGRPSAVFLNDPTAAVSNGGVTDFCAALSSTTIMCGKTDDSPEDPVNTSPVCDVGASSEVRSTNPGAPGTYTFRGVSISQRDKDNDGIENSLDSCPNSADTGWDGRVANSVNQTNGSDDDADGIANSCDSSCCPADVFPQDRDDDGWQNRLDNCPSVSNDFTAVNTGQNDRDIVLLTIVVPDGGTRSDGIGKECEANVGESFIPNGHYHFAHVVSHLCFTGTGVFDNDNDNVCDTYPGENDGINDTDGDGVLDDVDNCIEDSNAPPAGVAQQSPDINSNGTVQIDDVTAIASAFGKKSEVAGYRAAYELANQNDNIQIDDVTAIAGAFGDKC